MYFSYNTSAQKKPQFMNFSFFGGAAYPIGDFGSTIGEKASYAKTGFCGMFEMRKNLISNINWIGSLAADFNSFDEKTFHSQFGNNKISFSNYTSTWIMTGVGFEFSASSISKVYGTGQIGFLLFSFPDITYKNRNLNSIQTTQRGTATAFGIGGGFIMYGINLGVRYYTGEPEYIQKVNYNNYTDEVKVKVPVAVLQFIIGINV